MEDRDVPWSGPGAPPRAAANASWTADAGAVMSRRTRLVLEFLMVLMCAGAVTGNILVIVIVAATKTFHSVTSVLIMNLAVSDLLVGLGVMPFVALSIMNRRWADDAGLCLYVGYTSSVYCTASVLTLAAIALDRYHSIVDCLRYSARCTVWRTCAVVLWIWLQALATSCPPLLGWSSVGYVVPVFSCAVDWADTPSYTAFMLALSYLVPAVVILFCYVNIFKVARSHARRIHTLEDSVLRGRNPRSAPGVSPQHHCGRPIGPSGLVFHLSGHFESDISREEEGSNTSNALSDSATEQGGSTSSLSRGASQQHHNHHGVLRLFLVICAFFFCWTPYIGMALVRATETAISGQSSLVPPFAVTFSYWLMLLNSDINPLLYALLSKRFQGALQGLRQNIRGHLRRLVCRSREVSAEGDPCTLNTTRCSPASSSESSASDASKCSDSIYTVGTDYCFSGERLCRAWTTEHMSSCSAWQDSGADRRVDCLQVPSRPQEGSRLPFSALTVERQATFLYGQITVRVEHDVC